MSDVVRDESWYVLCHHGRPMACLECGEEYATELAAPTAPAEPPQDVQAAVAALALAYHKADKPYGEGEYGCGGQDCPGVKRLVAFLSRAVTALPCSLPHTILNGILARMRNDRARFRDAPGGSDVVSATTVDDWADEIEAALSRAPQVEPQGPSLRSQVEALWCIHGVDGQPWVQLNNVLALLPAETMKEKSE